MIKANSVTKVVDTSEGSLQILSPISFEVKSGESVAIIGASGSGKSTLLGLLAGLDQVTEGEIFLDGEGLHSMGEEERAVLRGNKVGFIFGLKHRAHHFPNQLSGGEQQRVAIARAFITSPKILFADEPTGNLDAKNSAKIESLLFQMNREKGTTLVLVTHDNELAEHCDRQLTMNAGELVETTDINVVSKKEAV